MSVEVIEIFITRMLNINNNVMYNWTGWTKIRCNGCTANNDTEILGSIPQFRTDKLGQFMTFGFKFTKNNMKNFHIITLIIPGNARIKITFERTTEMKGQSKATRITASVTMTISIHLKQKAEKIRHIRLDFRFAQLQGMLNRATIAKNNFMTFNGEQHSKYNKYKTDVTLV